MLVFVFWSISICMLKIPETEIFKLLMIIFKSCLSRGKFPLKLKKAKAVSIYEKSNKQALNNYRPVLLLSLYGEMS